VSDEQQQESVPGLAAAEREALVALDGWRVALDRAARKPNLEAKTDDPSWEDYTAASRTLYGAAHAVHEARKVAESREGVA